MIIEHIDKKRKRSASTKPRTAVESMRTAGRSTPRRKPDEVWIVTKRAPCGRPFFLVRTVSLFSLFRNPRRNTP